MDDGLKQAVDEARRAFLDSPGDRSLPGYREAEGAFDALGRGEYQTAFEHAERAAAANSNHWSMLRVFAKVVLYVSRTPPLKG
jgi:hypothetical protein